MFVLLFMCSYFIYQPFFFLFTSYTLNRNISYKQRYTLTKLVIDSSASFHVTSHSDFFTSYKTGDFGNVRMRNSSVSKIVGIGDIYLETSIGNKLVLKDVDMF